MSEPFLGQLLLVPYSFAPRGWAFCQGQLLSISQNTALFSLLGTTYGGNGQTTFALPDLRGRVPISFGQGPGLQNYNLGETGGVENVTLATAQMPIHNHSASGYGGTSDSTTPANTVPAKGGAYSDQAPATPMNAQMIGNAGGNQPHENRQPFLVLNWIISLVGIFPSRN